MNRNSGRKIVGNICAVIVPVLITEALLGPIRSVMNTASKNKRDKMILEAELKMKLKTAELKTKEESEKN